jgi:hypothetical protein
MLLNVEMVTTNLRLGLMLRLRGLPRRMKLSAQGRCSLRRFLIAREVLKEILIL